MNFLDNIINFVSPDAGLKRIRARVAGDALRKYDAASKGRRTEGWRSTSTSANAEIGTAIVNLRDRSRELVRNNPYASKAIDVLANNVVGTGIMPSFVASSEGGRKRVKAAWKKWAESKACDYNGQLNMYGLQSLVMRTVAESGEAIVLLRKVSSDEMEGGLPIKLQVLEGDYIDNSRDVQTLKDTGGYIMHGIEFDAKGKRTHYWLFERHPGDNTIKGPATSKRVPASEVLHIYKIERPGQIRGIPFGVSAMLRLKDFDDYEDAQLVRQKIAACFSVFVTDSADAVVEKSGDDDMPERLEPGIIERLPAGKEVHFASPPGAEGYADYSRKILQAIAGGYGVTYEALTGDMSNVNFSSGRMGWLEFHRSIANLQNNMIIPMFCDGVWKWVADAARILNAFPPNVEAEWTAPRREMIDPMNETKATSEAVRNGFKSWSEAVREQGYEPSSVLEELKQDAKAFDDAGLMPVCDPRFDANRKDPNAENSQNITPPQ